MKKAFYELNQEWKKMGFVAKVTWVDVDDDMFLIRFDFEAMYQVFETEGVNGGIVYPHFLADLVDRDGIQSSHFERVYPWLPVRDPKNKIRSPPVPCTQNHHLGPNFLECSCSRQVTKNQDSKLLLLLP
jgi:hypothetical protein